MAGKTKTARGELERRIVRMLEDAGHQVDTGVTLDWLTGRVPTDTDLAVPSRVRYRLVALHTRLGGDWEALQTKRARRLRVDMRVDGDTLIEVDETQHFSSARLLSLDFYEGLEHGLDLDHYRDLCIEFSDAADRYQKSQEAADFRFPGGRTAQRAYFDTARDLLAPLHGFRLVRVPAPSAEIDSAGRLALRALL